jgi:hypothetical protein
MQKNENLSRFRMLFKETGWIYFIVGQSERKKIVLQTHSQ